MFRTAALVLTLAVLLNLQGISAQRATVPAPESSEVSATRIRADVEFLADDLLEGREAATRGYDLAARYVATVLKAAGYAAGADDGTYFQQVPFIESTPTATSMRVTIDGTTTAVPLPDEGMVGASACQPTAEVTAPSRVRRLRGHGAGVRATTTTPASTSRARLSRSCRTRPASCRASHARTTRRGPQTEERRRPRCRCRRHRARSR